ncbi:MAG: mucoidy inhibitor MuiA [Candidatus Abyssubacteria bacterium]
MKKVLAVLPIFLLVTSLADASELPADARIASVVIYPDRAMVTRVADLTLERGEHTVVFGNLPVNMDTDSLRTEGRGQASVRIYSIESRKVILEKPRQESIAQLESQIQKVRDEIAAVAARIENLKHERELVRSIGVYAGDQFSKEFITRQPKPEEWNAMLEFERTQLAGISEEMLQADIETRELNEKLEALLRQLHELQGQAARASLEVKVVLSAEKPGPFRLLLSSVVYGVTWHPSYDARADVEKERVELDYIGNIRQNTGEDWNGVEVSLSTARPAIGAKMPEVTPWYLRPRAPVVETMTFDKALLREGREFEPSAAPTEMAEAEVLRLGTSVQFRVPRVMDIPSDNAYHRAVMLAADLSADLSYATTPRLSPFAYLTATLTNTTDAHWLPGEVSVFVDGDFIGKSRLDSIAPNEEVKLDLGIDESIEVKREELVRKEDETRILGKKKERMFKDRITLVNHKSKAVEILVIDQIPVSQHDDIEISGIRFSEKPTEREEDTGIVKWNLSLGPGERKEIIIGFTVTHPLDMMVIGI